MAEQPLTLIDPARGPGDPPWQAVDDPVMGGRSHGQVLFESGVMRFTGELSLAGGGGFSSVRTVGRTWNLAGRTALLLTVRGDGREYQLRLHDGALWQGRRVGHGCRFVAHAGPWQQVEVELDALVPMCRGEKVPAPRLERSRVLDLGLLIADRRAGPFSLEVAGIQAR
ncbi:MAG: CIA30 family protein [Xanthomonadales bacterium]|nr:CIA30 family protein [Xanthomonadales bacterium]